MAINVVLRRREFFFETKPGLFSKDEIDSGTKLLIGSMKVNPSDIVLDVGCGYGPIGIVAATLAFKNKTYLVDADIRAVKFTKTNIELNNIRNAQVLASDGFEEVKDIMFDLVLSNPPSHMPKETLIGFIEDAKKQLKPGGKLYFVTETRINPLIKREFKRVFGNYEEITSGPEHTVSLAYQEAQN